jgi:hypothetical protein
MGGGTSHRIGTRHDPYIGKMHIKKTENDREIGTVKLLGYDKNMAERVSS